MIVREQHDDVVRLRMSSFASRAIGMEVSAYVVRGVLVDTGFARAGRQLAPLLDALRPRGAILTHADEDHAGNASLVAARGIPMWIDSRTADVLRRRPEIRLYRRLVWGTPPRFEGDPELFVDPTIHTIHTPGHAVDHHVVWDTETHTLFSGDLFLGVRSRVMHEREDPEAIVRSLHRVIALRPRRMFDAHRGLIADPVAALTAKAQWMTETMATVGQKIDEGMSDATIVRTVLGGEEWSARFSGGEYARANFVKAVRRKRKVR